MEKILEILYFLAEWSDLLWTFSHSPSEIPHQINTNFTVDTAHIQTSVNQLCGNVMISYHFLIKQPIQEITFKLIMWAQGDRVSCSSNSPALKVWFLVECGYVLNTEQTLTIVPHTWLTTCMARENIHTQTCSSFCTSDIQIFEHHPYLILPKIHHKHAKTAPSSPRLVGMSNKGSGQFSVQTFLSQ